MKGEMDPKKSLFNIWYDSLPLYTLIPISLLISWGKIIWEEGKYIINSYYIISEVQDKK